MRHFFYVLVLTTAACGSNAAPDADPFDNMQMCFDEHHTTEGLSVNDAIVVCCIDHPIGPAGAQVHPSCKDTAAACVTYLTSDAIGMLTTASATSAQISAACDDYIVKKSQ